MTTGNEIVRRTPQQELALRVRQDDFKEQIAAALPPAVTTDRFIRVATTAILTNDDIGKCEPNSVMRALIRCAADGLMPDGKEAAIVKRNRKQGDNWIAEANYMAMIGGYRKKLAEHGWTLRTAVVYANDDFRHEVIDGEERIAHAPVRPGAARGDLIAAYAIAKHRDGRKLMSVLHPDDITKRRESSAYDAVWNAHPAAMWEKSAGRDVYDQVGLAEVDAERDRIASIIAANYDARTALYGPSTDSPVQDRPPTAGTAELTEHTGDAPQAGGAAQETDQTSSASASSAPGAQADDEPTVGGEPVATAETDQEIRTAADQAAMYRIPNGKYRDKPLGELMREDGGEGWLRNRLSVVTDPPEYVSALWSFARVYAPEAFQEALAKKEAEVQG